MLTTRTRDRRTQPGARRFQVIKSKIVDFDRGGFDCLHKVGDILIECMDGLYYNDRNPLSRIDLLNIPSYEWWYMEIDRLPIEK